MNTVLLDRRNGYAWVTLNRPDKLNSLNIELLNDLASVISECQSDANIRAVVITGAGPKAFAAGADISELNSQDGTTGNAFAQRGQRVLNQIEQLGKPVIAAVNGFALGGGCELAMACHMRFASESAKFGQPEINLGIIPGYGGTQRLSRLVGTPKALELILSGDVIAANEALRIGLVNRMLPAADLIAHTEAFAETLTTKAPLALTACLEATQQGASMSLSDGLALEASLFGQTCGTADFKEGTLAFLEKRAPSFKGT